MSDTAFDTGTDQLLVDVTDGVARVTFNNPAKHNALSLAIRRALPDTIAALESDPVVRVVVMTGAGTRAFMSGADISEFGAQRTAPEARAEYDRASAAVTGAWQALSKPIIAMIRGYCLGGGLLTALSADIRIASPDARFAVPAARLGLGYGFGGVQALSEVVGPAAAAEILFSARRFSAEEALAIGLVNRVVESDQLETAVMALAPPSPTTPPSPSPPASRRCASCAARPSTATCPRWPRWSRRASARRTTWRGRPPSPRTRAPNSAGADRAACP